MREFRSEIIEKGHERKPIDTFFTCSSDQIGPFMHASQSRDGLTFGQNVTFMGRSGIKVLKGGLRVAFISGIDSDLLGQEVKMADPAEQYLGNHFV